MGQNRFKKLSKFQKFQSSNFTLTWSNEGKMNSLRLDMAYSKELQQKMKILDKLILKTFELHNFGEILCHGHILELQSFSDGIERSLSQKGIINVYENIPIQSQQVHKVLFYNILSEGNKRDTN